MKAEDWLDDLETVSGFVGEKIGQVTGDMPIVKAAGQFAANPTPQEFGSQVAQLGQSASKSMQEAFGGDPVDVAINYGPNAMARIAYHGTPHKILGGFKKEAIGSGEGAQAFGHGFYTTESKDVAKYYRDTLTEVPYQYKVKGKDAQKWMNELSMSNKVEDLEWAEVLESILGKHSHTSELKKLYTKGNGYSPQTVKAVNLLKETDIKAFDVDAKEISRGRIYTLDIPDKDVMLDWDKPFNKQPEAVKKTFKDIGLLKEYNQNLQDFSAPRDTRGSEKRGHNFYAYLANKLGGEDKASQYLYSKGIKGIDYPAGTLAGDKTSARNQAIFEPSDIKILAEDFLDQ